MKGSLMYRRFRLLSLFASLALILTGGLAAHVLAQGATPQATPRAALPLEIPLLNVEGAEAGTATFEEGDDGLVTMAVAVEGLEAGEPGIHIHESGVCDPAGVEPFSTAGGHYNPTGDSHGAPDDPMSHAGDFGNLTIGEDGTGTLDISTNRFTLSDGPTSLFDADGSALVLHELTDDLVTDPAGMSGARVACGVVAEPLPAAGAPDAAAMEGALLNPEPVPFADDLLGRLQAPAGFEISVFAQGLTNPRMLTVVADGIVLVSQPSANQVSVLRDTDGDGAVDESEVVATNLPMVHGMAIEGEQLYLAGENTIWVADLMADGTLDAPSVVVDDLPDGDQHGRHTLAFGPDGGLYVSVGSSCNVCTETNDENATILRMNPDGSERTIFALGLRNTLGWGWHPETGDLWGMDQGSDWRGDDQPPEELNQIVEGGNYGWPFCFGDRQIDEYNSQAPAGSTAEQYCALTEAPAINYQAHSSPIGMVYYTADQFPADYQGDAFVAMRGSWNRDPVTGYKIVRVQFEDGQPVAIEDFITGWLMDDGASQFGRVAGLALLPDGSLLISEDTNGVIYRVTYTGE